MTLVGTPAIRLIVCAKGLVTASDERNEFQASLVCLADKVRGVGLTVYGRHPYDPGCAS